MKRLFLLSLTLAAFAPAAASTAMADAKVYSAASCHTSIGIPVLSTGGAIINGSLTLPVLVICPLVRDNTTTKPTSISVGVVDNSSPVLTDGNFHCRVVGTTDTGKTNINGAEAATSGTNSSGQTLSLPIPPLPADATMSVRCSIPRRGAGDPASILGSIKVVEPDPGN